MTTPQTIGIIGGGVAGLGPAWQLATRGWNVHLFERDTIGSGASRRAAGMLAPTSEVTFEEKQLLRIGQQSLQMYPDWIDELTAISGVDVDYRREGTLIVAVDRDDAEALEHLYQYHQRLGLDVERLVGDDARQLEPGLSPNIHYALFTPHDHQVDPIRLIDALGKAFVAAGGHLHEDTEVAGVELGDDGVRAIRLDDSTAIDTEAAVVAAGAWSPRLDGIDDVLPHIRPVRGQMLAVELGSPPIIDRVVRAPDAYLVPKSDGRLLIGSTMEERGFDERLTAGGLFDILEGAWEAVPGIYDAPVVDTWTGFRPLTLANQPVIGPTAIDGLFLSVGHGRNGILLSAATGYGLAEAIDTGHIPDYLRPFAPQGGSE